ncbi:MAG: YdcF family protein [Acidobacteria bacterium]|nr:YdcF family protein [Acidobacteriota bacterium]
MRLASVLVALAAVLMSALGFGVSRAGRWLVRTVPIKRCDLMVVLGGGARERVGSAIDLMLSGACGDILFTGESLDSFSMAFPLERARVPRDRLFCEVSGSTFDDARAALRRARASGRKSLLVITSPFHTRRAAWVFSRVLAGSGVEFGVYPSESMYVDYERWWSTPDGIAVVTGEYRRLAVAGLLSGLLTASAGARAVAGPLGAPVPGIAILTR